MENIAQVSIADLQPFPNDQIETFFNRCVDEVAAKLIGMYLFNKVDGIQVGGQIIETESYCQNDPAAHCYDRKNPGQPNVTKMCKSMVCPAGYVYVFPNSKKKAARCSPQFRHWIKNGRRWRSYPVFETDLRNPEYVKTSTTTHELERG